MFSRGSPLLTVLELFHSASKTYFNSNFLLIFLGLRSS